MRRWCWRSAPRARTCARCSSASSSTTIWTAKPTENTARATRDAVILFQRRNGLTVDGRVGPDTAAALGVTLSSLRLLVPPRRRSSPPTTAAGQAGLRRGARGELQGAVAVAAVVLNRVESASFPNTSAASSTRAGPFPASPMARSTTRPIPRPSARRWTPSTAGTPRAAASTTTIPARPTTNGYARARSKTVIGNHYFAV